MSSIKNFSGTVANKKRQAGLALLEMIIAIGILGVISAAVVMLSTKAFSSMNVKDTVASLTALDSSIKSSYRSQGNYEGIEGQVNEKEESKRIIPAHLFKSPFGGNYTLTALTAGVQKNRGFRIGVNGLNIEQCTKVIESLGNSFRYIGTNATILDISTKKTKAEITSSSDIVVLNGVFDLSPLHVKKVCSASSDIYVGNS